MHKCLIKCQLGSYGLINQEGKGLLLGKLLVNDFFGDPNSPPDELKKEGRITEGFNTSVLDLVNGEVHIGYDRQEEMEPLVMPEKLFYRLLELFETLYEPRRDWIIIEFDDELNFHIQTARGEDIRLRA